MVSKIESNEYLNKANLIKYLTQLQKIGRASCRERV